MATTFDFETALKQLQSGQALTGENGILTPLIKQLTEAALEAEIENYIEANPKQGNRRNGYTRKTVKSTSGSFELETPRDRNGEFEPQLVKKNQTKLSEEIDNKIISLYALGMSYRDIQKHVADMYGLEISDGAITNITDKLLPQLQAWKQRPLDTIYPFVWLDAIHYKVKDKGVYVSKAIYTILALNVEGKKELLGLHLSESEGANHWLSVLTDLQNRGVQDILIACLAKQRFSGLKGFPDAIASVYPHTDIQLCIVHVVRNSLRFVSWKDYKVVTAGLKAIYQASTEENALKSLDIFCDQWNHQYSKIGESWRANWENIRTIFSYPAEIRHAIYTTNAIESLNSVIRHSTKKRKIFSSDDSVKKVIYLATSNAAKKWTMPIQNWRLAMNWFTIQFDDRLKDHL